MLVTIYCCLLIALNLVINCECQDYKLVWSDEFNDQINEKDWRFEMDCLGGGNNEQQCYTKRKENAFIKDGSLVIHSIVEEYDGKHYTSSRMHLRHSGWTYGKFEARAKMPKGKHLWPAIWLYPQDSIFGTWAASGEIDIVEFRGEVTNQIQGSIHYGGYWPHNAYSGSGETNFTVDFTADYHIFTFEWNQNEMRWLLDNKEYHKENMKRSFYSGNGPNPYTKDGEPFNQNFVWILNIAVGGDFFPESRFGKFSVDDAKQWPKPTMEVDYVRVYQTAEQMALNNITQISTNPPDNPTTVGSTVRTTQTPTPTPTTGRTTQSQTTVHPTTPHSGKSLLDADGCCPAYTGRSCNFDAQHQCVADETGKIVLCGLNAGACNGQCYADQTYRCVNGKLEHL